VISWTISAGQGCQDEILLPFIFIEILFFVNSPNLAAAWSWQRSYYKIISKSKNNKINFKLINAFTYGLMLIEGILMSAHFCKILKTMNHEP
jgi:hypothetical protein